MRELLTVLSSGAASWLKKRVDVEGRARVLKVDVANRRQGVLKDPFRRGIARIHKATAITRD